MNTKTDATPSENKLDLLKWISVMFLVGSGLVGFYYFEGHSLLIRVVSLLTLLSIAAWIATRTEKGRLALDFFRESHLEVRKVVWPTREETLQMTGIVVLLVIVLSIFIWILDGILMWLVRLLTS